MFDDGSLGDHSDHGFNLVSDTSKQHSSADAQLIFWRELSEFSQRVLANVPSAWIVYGADRK